MDKEKKERLEGKGWKIGTAEEFLNDVMESDPIRELCFVKPSMWIRAYDGLWTRRRESKERCHKCKSHINVRVVEVQIIPTDDDWKALGLEGVSVSYVPWRGHLEIHWCPDCRRVVATALDSDRKECLYDDQEEGYAKTPTLTPSEAYDKVVKEKEFWRNSDFNAGRRYFKLYTFIREQIERHDTQLEDRKCMCEFCEPARKIIGD